MAGIVSVSEKDSPILQDNRLHFGTAAACKPSGASGIFIHHPFYVIFGFRDRRNSIDLLNPCRPRIIGSKRQSKTALELFEQVFKLFDPPLDILLGIERITNSHIAGGFRHQLHHSDSTLIRNSSWIPV